MDVAPYRYKRTWVSLIQNTKIQLQIQNTNWNTKYKQPLLSLTLHLTCKHLPRANSADWRHSPFSLDHSFDDDDDDDDICWWWWRIKAFACSLDHCWALTCWKYLPGFEPVSFHRFMIFLFVHIMTFHVTQKLWIPPKSKANEKVQISQLEIVLRNCKSLSTER